MEIRGNMKTYRLNQYSLKFLLHASALAALACCSSLLAGTSTAGGKVVLADKAAIVEPEPVHSWGGPLFGGGVKSNDEFTEGNLFLVYPWLNSVGDGGVMDGSVGFIEPYVSWGEGDELGASLGLGFRHLFSDQSSADAARGSAAGFFDEGVYVGANVFVDYLRTPSESDFWQSGFGVEVGTRYVELRGNYYLPWSDERVLGRRTETSTFTSSSSSSSVSTGPTTVRDGRFVEDFWRTNTTRETTTTRRQTFETFEEPLEGWDVELAVLMPFIDQYLDMQLIGGYYQYSGDRSQQDDLDGWRAGVEIRPVPALVLGATWFENDRLYQSDWLASISIELPLGGGWRKSFTPRRRHLAERLFERVGRKNASITTSGVEEDHISDTTSRSTTTTTRTTDGSNDLGPIPRSTPAPVAPTPAPAPAPVAPTPPPMDEEEQDGPMPE
jgi:hypothetical protein